MRRARRWHAGWNRWRVSLRLARRDAARHRVRTALSALLVALPVAALVAGTALSTATLPSRDVALAGVPEGAQAVITSTAINRQSPPFPQVPEGAPGPWVDDLSQVPASADELSSLLAPGSRLLPYWDVPQILVTTGVTLAPGEEAAAGAGIDEHTELATIAAAAMQEAGSEAFSLLVPTIESGANPSNATEAVVSTALAQRLGIDVGDDVAVVAPPATGWYSTDGRIGDVVQDQQRGYRVSGITDSSALQIWAQDGWISSLVDADPAGVDRRWLVVGDEPVTWQQAKSMNHLQAFAVSRHVLSNYPSADELYPVLIDANALLLRIGSVLLTGALGSALVLLLLTPAFVVSTDQSRRMLGHAAASGAAPAELRRIVNAQGIVIGVAGGTAGAALGVVVAFITDAAMTQDLDLALTFPWWIIPTGIAIAALLGVVTTLIPAATAARLNPVDAMRDRATLKSPASPRAIRIRVLAAPLALLASIVTGWLGLASVRAISDENASPGTLPAATIPAALLLLATLVLAITGLLLLVRLLPSFGARIAGRLPLAPRLALRDAADHRPRFVSAVTAVLVATCVASYLLVMVGSTTANDRDRTGEMIQGGRFVLAAQVPVSDAVDRLVINDAMTMLEASMPNIGHEPVHSATTGENTGLHVGVVQPADRTCPAEHYPDAASSIELGAPLVCVSWERAYTPSLSVPWLGGSDVGILDGDALRATGIEGAAAAAEVLDRGGVVVNNAARISASGTVRLALSTDSLPDEHNAERFVELPASFLRGFAFAVTVTADTAADLGVTNWAYMGEIVTASPELTPAQLNETRALINQHTSLVRMTEPRSHQPWGRDVALVPSALLAALAVAAATISVLLAKTQIRQDMTSMHAIGASPGFVRRFALSQGALIIAAGLSIGLAGGIALGSYQIAWNRATGIGGAWLETVPLWGLQSTLGFCVLTASLAAVLLVGRPVRTIERHPAS